MTHEGNSHFLMALGRHDEGSVVETADEALRDVISQVMRTGKKGSVTLTMEVEPNGPKGLEVSCKLAAKAPQLAFGKSFYFTNQSGDLTRTPPRGEEGQLLRMERD